MFAEKSVFSDQTENLSGEKQNEFRNSFNELCQGQLEEYLNNLKSPCYESDLMSVAFPGFKILSASPLCLYQRHFQLFHCLFILQKKLYDEGKFLFVHFMRTFLLALPESSRCRYYEPHLGKFCGEKNQIGREFCYFHNSKIGENQLEELSERYFYFDIRNYFALDEETVSEFIRGGWELLEQREKIKRCFEVLGLPPGSNQKKLKAAFRELARQFHPDSGNGNEERFKLINNAYHFLIRIWAGRILPKPETHEDENFVSSQKVEVNDDYR